MSRRYGTFTPRRRAALRKAQLTSAAKRRGRGKLSTKKKVLIGAAVLGAGATGVYAVDRKVNTMKVYHGTTHHRARKIHSEGYKTKHKARAYRNKVDGKLHESGRVFISTSPQLNTYGRAVVSSRIRKKKFKKYATQDVHPMSAKMRKLGLISYDNSDHYHIQTKNMKKAGLKLKYSRSARKMAGKKIRSRYEMGSSKIHYE